MSQSPEQIGLKDLDEAQLFDSILEADNNWGAEQRELLTIAYGLAGLVHIDDKHRGKPYAYHFLRNTARIVQYFHITDPEILAGSILHDSVEDHPGKILKYYRANIGGKALDGSVELDSFMQRRLALDALSEMFTPRTSQMVDGMSNPLKQPGQNLTADQKLEAYVGHVTQAIESPDVFFGKLSDWADNGLGIVHSESTIPNIRKRHFSRKYGAVLPHLEARFERQDIQDMLDPAAVANIQQMFVLGRERLTAA